MTDKQGGEPTADEMRQFLDTWDPTQCPVCKGAELVWYVDEEALDKCREPNCIAQQKLAREYWERLYPTMPTNHDDIPF